MTNDAYARTAMNCAKQSDRMACDKKQWLDISFIRRGPFPYLAYTKNKDYTFSKIVRCSQSYYFDFDQCIVI